MMQGRLHIEQKEKRIQEQNLLCVEGAYPDEKELKANTEVSEYLYSCDGCLYSRHWSAMVYPIRKKILNRIDRREPVSNGLKIAATWSV